MTTDPNKGPTPASDRKRRNSASDLGLGDGITSKLSPRAVSLLTFSLFTAGLVVILTISTFGKDAVSNQISSALLASATINVAGRQRMLSENIGRLVLGMYIDGSSNPSGVNFTSSSNLLKSSLNLITVSNSALRYGDSTIGVDGRNTADSLAVWEKSQPLLTQLTGNASSVLTLTAQWTGSAGQISQLYTLASSVRSLIPLFRAEANTFTNIQDIVAQQAQHDLDDEQTGSAFPLIPARILTCISHSSAGSGAPLPSSFASKFSSSAFLLQS